MKGCYEYLRESAERLPEKTALVYGDSRRTYRELVAEIDALALGMQEAGIGRGSVAAILFRNCITVAECFFALWKLGAVAAPMNFRENRQGIENMLRLSGAAYILCEDVYADLARAAAETVAPEKICVMPAALSGFGPTIREMLFGRHPVRNAGTPGADAEALYVFTSGTTGMPKVAVHTQAALTEFALRCREHGNLYDPEDVFLSYSPLCHIGGMRILLGNLLCGATLVLTASFKPEEVLELITRERVSQMFVIPPAIVTRLQTVTQGSGIKLPSVRRIRMSGGMCTPQTVETLFDFFPGCTLINGYGSSESAVSLFNAFTREDYERNPQLYRSVGKPLRGCQVKLTDGSGAEIDEPGKVGEAYGKCAFKFKRYQLHSGSVYPEEWCDTGDLMYRDPEGNYYFCGRTKDIIKTGGENVFAGEVEEVIAKYPPVAECAVFGVPNDTLGEAISAAIVLREGEKPDAAALVSFCKGHMASYKKPIHVFFMREIPKTVSGKAKKYVLREMAVSGALDTGGDKS